MRSDSADQSGHHDKHRHQPHGQPDKLSGGQLSAAAAYRRLVAFVSGLMLIAVLPLPVGGALPLELLLVQQFRVALLVEIHPKAAGWLVIRAAMGTQVTLVIAVPFAAGLTFDT